MKRFLVALLLAAVAASATMMDLSYPGGKQSGTFTITLENGKAISPDTVRIGAALMLRVYHRVSPLTVCNNRGELGIQVFPAGDGRTFRRTNGDTNWAAYPTPHSLSSNAPADSIPVMPPFNSADSSRAQGWIVARPGDWDCMTDTYSMDDNYRQLLFPQGGGYYAKIQLASFTEAVPGPPPPMYQPRILNTITIRYIVNTDADLSDLVSSVRPGRASPRGLRVEHERYNPLGVRLRREPGRFEPTLPAPRTP